MADFTMAFKYSRIRSRIRSLIIDSPLEQLNFVTYLSVASKGSDYGNATVYPYVSAKISEIFRTSLGRALTCRNQRHKNKSIMYKMKRSSNPTPMRSRSS